MTEWKGRVFQLLLLPFQQGAVSIILLLGLINNITWSVVQPYSGAENMQKLSALSASQHMKLCVDIKVVCCFQRVHLGKSHREP